MTLTLPISKSKTRTEVPQMSNQHPPFPPYSIVSASINTVKIYFLIEH